MISIQNLDVYALKVIDERKAGDITNWEELGSLDICLGREFLVHTKGSFASLCVNQRLVDGQ